MMIYIYIYDDINMVIKYRIWEYPMLSMYKMWGSDQKQG